MKRRVTEVPTPVNPSMSKGAVPETFRKFLKFCLRIQYGEHTSFPEYFEDTSWRHTQVLLNFVK